MTTLGPVWGLDTGRPGEFMQVETLGVALGLGFERIRLSPEGGALQPPGVAPRIILSFGRAAQAALRLAAALPARPLLVHLGTPGQTPITAFDLIIPMPQDDYPAAPNVHFLRLPLNGAALDAALPSPPAGTRRCTVIIGGPSRHFLLPRRAIRRLIGFAIRLAGARGETLHVVTSPRTPAPVLAELDALRARHGFELLRYGEAPFARILQSGSRFVVTGDSASMLAQACRTGAPVWLFALPPRPNVSDLLQHAADYCFGPAFRHRLVRQGRVGGGTNFRRWHRTLELQGHISIATSRLSEAMLGWAPGGPRDDPDLADCRARILAMLPAAGRQPCPAIAIPL